MGQDVPELGVENPHVMEDAVKDKREAVDADEVESKTTKRAPRMFRRSLIFKTMNLFGSDNEQKMSRPFKEK